jgi:hypothetical protein
MAERNPSPPRFSAEEKELIESDNIGDTMFSKKWVLKTLMKLVERTNNEDEKSDHENEAESGVNGDEASETEDNVNIDEEFDSELCELWDMSMNKVNKQLAYLCTCLCLCSVIVVLICV